MSWLHKLNPFGKNANSLTPEECKAMQANYATRTKKFKSKHKSSSLNDMLTNQKNIERIGQKLNNECASLLVGNPIPHGGYRHKTHHKRRGSRRSTRHTRRKTHRKRRA